MPVIMRIMFIMGMFRLIISIIIGIPPIMTGARLGWVACGVVCAGAGAGAALSVG
jgi:hypothetical protein